MPDFVNPIIQAMVQTAQLSQQNKKRVADEEADKVAQKQRDEQLKQAAKIAEDSHQADLNRNDLLHEANNLKIRADHQTYVKDVLNRIATGSLKKEAVTSKDDPNSADIDGEKIPLNQLQGPDDFNAIQVKNQTALKTAEQNALEPFKAADDARALTQATKVADINASRAKEVADINDKRAREVEEMHAKNEMKLHQFDAQARIQLAGATGTDPGANIINDIYVTGNRALPAGKIGNGISANAPKGWTPVVKKDSETIEGLPTITSLFANARELADYQYDQGLLKAGKTALGIGDGAVLKNQLMGQLGAISRYFGKERGVLTQGDINRAEKLFNSKTLTKDEVLDGLDKLEKQFKVSIGATLNKYPEDQREAILTSRGLHPEDFKASNEKKQSSTPKIEEWIRKDGKLVKK